MATVSAELVVTRTATVEIDVEKFCSVYAQERAEFDGDDIEFVIDSIYEIGVEDLVDCREDDGVSVVDDFRDEEIRVLR